MPYVTNNMEFTWNHVGKPNPVTDLKETWSSKETSDYSPCCTVCINFKGKENYQRVLAIEWCVKYCGFMWDEFLVTLVEEERFGIKDIKLLK